MKGKKIENRRRKELVEEHVGERRISGAGR